MSSTALHGFHVVGVTYRTAPVGVRERLILAPAEAAAWLEEQRSAGRCAAILSTCNRFEVYWWGRHDLEPWFHGLMRARGVDLGRIIARSDGAACVRHLYQVAAGLDSQILGETEILGQVRRTHQVTQQAGASSRELDALFSGAVAAGRRIRRETRLGKHPASVSAAAVEVAFAAMPQQRPPTVVILGAGEVAAGVLRALTAHRVHRVVLVSRRPERAASLAVQGKADSLPWTELGSLLPQADLVFVTTGARHALVRAEDLAAVTAQRSSDLVMLDLAVPRNVEPAARALAKVRLLDLDDLHPGYCPAAGRSSPAVAEAHRRIEDELARLDASLRARGAAPRLAELHRLGVQLARQEADRTLAGLDHLSDTERRIVRDMGERLVRRLLYAVSQELRGVLTGPADGTRRTA
jgi:glutamyl-tRNA reductase